MRKERNEYYRYCVVSEEKKLVYIGVSRAKNVQAILRKHIRGEIPETADYFGVEENKMIPILYRSKYRQEKEDAESFSIWNTVFLEDGYVLLHKNKETTQDLILITTEQILDGQVFRTKNSGAEKRGNRQRFTAEPAITSFSMRIAHSTAARFKSLCRERGLTQSQMLSMLIDEFTGANDLLLQDIDRRINAAALALDREKLTREERESQLLDRLNKHREQQMIIKKALGTHLKDRAHAVEDDDELIPKYTNKQAKEDFRDKYQYKYPNEPGIMRVEIDALYYGQPGWPGVSALFVCGRNKETGDLVRFRYYPKEEYVGVSPMEPLFRKEGQLFVVGYTKASDDAMDLLCAFTVNPRPITYGYLHAEDYTLNGMSVPWEKKSVDKLISSAREKSRKTIE